MQTQSKPRGSMKANEEQALLDACWSGIMIGDRVRTKIMEKLNRVTKLRQSQPPVSKRIERKNLVCSSIKKNNNSSKTIEDPDHFASSMMYVPVNITRSICISPHRSIGRSSIASSILSGFNATSIFNNGVNPELERTQVDLSQTINDNTKNKRQRRGRKERGKYANIENDVSINTSTSIKNEKGFTEQSKSKLDQSIISSISNKSDIAMNRSKSGIRRSVVQIDNDRSFVKPFSIVKQDQKIIKVNSKKTNDPKRYIARSYLGELYDKIAFKVKELERDKKYLINNKKNIENNTKQKSCNNRVKRIIKV